MDLTAVKCPSGYEVSLRQGTGYSQRIVSRLQLKGVDMVSWLIKR